MDRQVAERAEPSPRKRRRLWWVFWLFLPLLAVAILGTAFVLWSLKHEPEFYSAARAQLKDPQVRKTAVVQFEARTGELIESIRAKKPWQQEFTQDQINSWLIDELPKRTNRSLPKEVRDPLMEFKPQTVRVGCYVDTEQYRGVVSIEAKPTLIDGRTLSLEVTSIQAGSLSVPAASLIQTAVEKLHAQNVPIEWAGDSEHNIVHITLPESVTELKGIELKGVTVSEGTLTLEGDAGK